MEEGPIDAELVPVPQGAADNAAQHIAAALVGGQHAVQHEKGARTDVIGDHAQGGGLVDRARHFGAHGRQQSLEEIDVVVVVDALQDRGDALQAHPGIDRGMRDRLEYAVGGPLVLHEHEIPDLDVAIAVGIRATGWPTRNIGTVIVEDLRTRAARPGIAHHPEVVLLAATREARRIDAHLVQPDVGGFVIVLEDRHPQALRRQAEALRQQAPGETDGLALEIGTEAEIAEHLEERVMPRRVPHVVEIVVLAAGAHTALRRRRTLEAALLEAEEDVLELHHAGVGEQQRRIVARHQRAALDHGVAMLREIIEESLADVRGLHDRSFVPLHNGFVRRRTNGTRENGSGGPARPGRPAGAGTCAGSRCAPAR